MYAHVDRLFIAYHQLLPTNEHAFIGFIAVYLVDVPVVHGGHSQPRQLFLADVVELFPGLPQAVG
jgi:hypothetical protein